MRKSFVVEKILEAEAAGDLDTIRALLPELRAARDAEMEISETAITGPMSGTKYKHPSYAVVTIGAPQGGNGSFFGSGVHHNQFMTLEVHTASLRRAGYDHISPETSIVRLKMTHDQWARMVASQGKGCGTPCTIEHLDGKRMPEPPRIDKRSQHSAEFDARMKKLARDLKVVISADVEALKASGSLPMAQRKEMANRISMVMQEIGSNIPFFQTQFVEEMEKVVSSLKIDVEAWVSSTLAQNGLPQGTVVDTLLLDHDKGVDQ